MNLNLTYIGEAWNRPLHCPRGVQRIHPVCKEYQYGKLINKIKIKQTSDFNFIEPFPDDSLIPYINSSIQNYHLFALFLHIFLLSVWVISLFYIYFWILIYFFITFALELIFLNILTERPTKTPTPILAVFTNRFVIFSHRPFNLNEFFKPNNI